VSVDCNRSGSQKISDELEVRRWAAGRAKGYEARSAKLESNVSKIPGLASEKEKGKTHSRLVFAGKKKEARNKGGDKMSGSAEKEAKDGLDIRKVKSRREGPYTAARRDNEGDTN